MYPLLTNINSQFIDSCGKPLSGGKVYTYEANTTTPKLTYADTNGQSPNTNPIILDESGRANIYMADGAYRIRVLDKKDALVADTPKISRYVTNTELETFIQNIEAGLSELEQVKESLDIFVNAAIAEQKGAAGGLAPLDELSKIDNFYLWAASEEKSGISEIATQAETDAAVDDVRIVTPKKLLAGLKKHLNVSGDAPMFACRAWVNFNGTDTVAIRASGNISSITDNSVGSYSLNLITPLPDTNFSISGFAKDVAEAYRVACVTAALSDVSTTSKIDFQVRYASGNSANIDSSLVCVSIYR